MNKAEDPSADLININVSFSTINTILPHLTGMEPEFFVAPFSADSTSKNARIQEAFLNRMWRHKPVGAQIALKKSVYDYLVYGDGYLKTTWQIVTRSTGVDQSADVAETFIDRVSPWDVWIDPNSEGVDKARWVAIRIWTTEEEARADKTLKIPASFNFTIIDPVTDAEEDTGDRPYHATSTSRKWVVLYEMYDTVTRTLYVVPRDGDKMPWKVVEDIELPLEQIPGYTIAQSPYHMGDLEQIWDVQMEIDKTRSQQISHRKRNVSKILVKKDSMSPEAEAAMRSSTVGEMVPITGEMPLNEMVMPVQLAPLPSESYAMASQAQQDVFEITGISEYQRGTAPEITRTATEAQIMQGSANVKIDAKLSDIEHALRNIGEYMLGVARDVYPQTDVDEMALFVGGADGRAINQLQAGEDIQSALQDGDDGAADQIAASAGLFGETVITPTDDIFVGRYEVLVQHASTDAINPRVKAQKYKDVTSFLVEYQPVLSQMGVNVDISKMIRLWLEAESIPGVEAILAGTAPPPAPEQSGLPPQGEGAGGLPQELMAALSQGVPDGIVPGEFGPPIGPENSGALDPNDYPFVG